MYGLIENERAFIWDLYVDLAKPKSGAPLFFTGTY